MDQSFGNTTDVCVLSSFMYSLRAAKKLARHFTFKLTDRV